MEAEVSRCALRERAYAMKKHHATRLHYDLRMEWNGVLLSWALPDDGRQLERLTNDKQNSRRATTI